jgi:hypothetical protein
LPARARCPPRAAGLWLFDATVLLGLALLVRLWPRAAGRDACIAQDGAVSALAAMGTLGALLARPFALDGRLKIAARYATSVLASLVAWTNALRALLQQPTAVRRTLRPLRR